MPKIILAGPSERQQYLTHDYNDTTMRFVLNYPGLIDPTVMQAAVKAIVESVDILHGTFFVDGVNAYWKLNDQVDPIHYFHYVRCDGDPAETAYTISLFPVFPEDRVQIRVWLIQSNSASSLVVCIGHLVCDGGDGKYLLGKIVEAYNQLLNNGNLEGFEVKNGSRAPEKIYSKLSAKEMKGLMSNLSLGDVKSMYPFPNEEDGMVRHIRKVIPVEVMNAARQKAKTVGASANDLLVAAMNMAYAELPGIDRTAPVALTSLMDLRKHCENGESEGLCNMSGVMPTTLENGIPETFEETLVQIAEKTKIIKEDPYAGLSGMPIMHGVIRTMPMGLMLKFVGKLYEKVSFGLTNLGNLKCADFALGELVPNGGFFGGPVKKKPGMQIAVMSFDGECVLSVCGQFTDEDDVQLRATLDSMIGYIRTYAEI